MVPTSNASSPKIVLAPIPPKEYAHEVASLEYGWGPKEHKCLNILWGKEAAWNYEAVSPTDDYGIPQRHMRKNTQKEIDDFMSSPYVQINWGLKYIQHRYSSPCKAWAWWQENRWY